MSVRPGERALRTDEPHRRPLPNGPNRLVYKVFDSGLKQSLFLPGLSALSTKLITVQRALFCLVCLFLPTAHPTRLSFSPQTFCRMACFTAGTAGLLRLRPVCIIARVLPSPEERSRDSRRCAALNRHGRKPRYARRGITVWITIRYSGSELKAQLLNNGMSRDVLYVSRLCRTKCYGVSSAIRGRPPLDEKAHRRGCPSASESMSGVGDSRVGGGVPSTAGKGYGRLQGAPAAHVSRGGAAWRDVGCSFPLASSPFVFSLIHSLSLFFSISLSSPPHPSFSLSLALSLSLPLSSSISPYCLSFAFLCLDHSRSPCWSALTGVKIEPLWRSSDSRASLLAGIDHPSQSMLTTSGSG
ncbi:hypothetical protein ALC56_02131 [Trachymyrmex septentrionalis]|uniref:Uncharacterized protein n=1 Tax=Trachymyrmex septentrionalis TaxID=34720 RepID=A0A195FS18_9HYME|nr:hypothetical protein ALC56_02131 [Trachymyrmex septentrionalis]